MKGKKLYWSLFCIGLFSVVLFLVSACNSLWFLQGLLGDAPGQYLIGYRTSAVTSQVLGKGLLGQVERFIPRVSGEYSRFVYKKDEQGQYIAGVPKLTSQLSIVKRLEAQSWKVRRIGWIVIARNSSTAAMPESRISYAAKNVLHAITVGHLPLNPVSIIQLNVGVENPFSLYAEKNYKGLHLTINKQSADFFRGDSGRMKKNPLLEETTFVALQRDVLPYMPSGFLNAIERKLSDAMRFTKTNPRMLEGFLSKGLVEIAINKDSVAIGVISTDSSPASLVNEWINTEQGTRHPKKKAFSLPDKTLGYEYIPGQSNAYFSLNKEKNRCLSSENYDENVFLCGKDQVVIFSSDEAIGTQLMSFSGDGGVSQKGIIQGAGMEVIGMNDIFERIEYSVSGDILEVWADTKTK